MNRLGTILGDWRGETLHHLDDAFKALFEASADVLLEYANKAQNDKISRSFFEALQEVRRNGPQVQEHFHAGLSRCLTAYEESNSRKPSASAEVLKLVDPEDFERGLALQMIADHAERDHAELMRALAFRLGALQGTKPVKYENLPAGPNQITTQFAVSSTLLQVGHESRLVLYTLFERFVMPRAIESLAKLNEQLAAAGILPNLPSYSAPIQPRGQTTPKRSTANTAPRDPGAQTMSNPDTGERLPQLGDEMLLRIRDLLASRRAMQRPAGAVRLPPVPPAPVSEVIATIAALPGSPAPAPVPADLVTEAVSSSAPQLHEIRQSLFDQRSQIREALGQERVSPEIDDIIEIIGAIFEIMLNEPNLPDVVKALLSHLHTSYLKYAVTDPALLDDSRHPARCWLDDMVNTGVQWVDPANLKLGLYPWMSDAVLQVTAAKSLSKHLFEVLQRSLAEQLSKQSSKQQKLEKRAGEHARGRAMLDHAKEIAQDEMSGLLATYPADSPATRFLEDVWLDYLTLLLLRSNNNPTASSVQSAVELAKKVYEVTLKAQRDRRKAEHAINALDAELEAGIGSIVPHVVPRIKAFTTSLREDVSATAKPAASPSPRTHRRPQRPQPAPLTPQEQTVAKQLTRLPPGTRFWRKAADGHTDTTVSLVWFNEQTLRLMFADLAGHNAGIYTLKEVASDILKGDTRILEEENASFIERALRSFQALLKQGL